MRIVNRRQPVFGRQENINPLVVNKEAGDMFPHFHSPVVTNVVALWADTTTGDPTLKATAQVLDQYGNGMNGQVVTFTIIASSNAIGTGFFNPNINTLSITATALTANGDFLPASGTDLRDGVAIAPYVGTSAINRTNPLLAKSLWPQIILRASCGGVLSENRTEWIFIGAALGEP